MAKRHCVPSGKLRVEGNSKYKRKVIITFYSQLKKIINNQ